MKTIILSIATVLAVFSFSAYATIINIPDEYPTIQRGIDASADGDTVLVQPGAYVENINFNGHNIALGSLFFTTGNTSYISNTVVDGNHLGPVVVFKNGESSNTVISGFTIKNGDDGWPDFGGGISCLSSNPSIIGNIIRDNFGSYGGGICCVFSNPAIADNFIGDNYASYGGGISCIVDSNPVVSHNNIKSNHAIVDNVGYGGGIYCLDSSPTIIDNTIGENEAYLLGIGGGIFLQRSDAIVTRNRIIGNTAAEGGAIGCIFSNPRIKGNLISQNTAGFGGGIACVETDAIISNNIFIANFAVRGGGIYCDEISDTTSILIINNTLAENSADSNGGSGLCYWGEGNTIIANTIFQNDDLPEILLEFGSPSPAITYSAIQGGWEGEGNIDINPLFRDPDNGNFRLMSIYCGDPYESPCIDAGDPAVIDSLLDCSWGLGTIRSDMGAYGGGDSAMVGIDDYYELLPRKAVLLQNYPNPFNSSTSIRFTLPEPSNMAVEVYDILGRRVAVLYDGYSPAGSYSIGWDARDYPTGIYIARMRAGERSKNMKMVLVK